MDVSCQGLRIVQTGLPPRTLFDVEAINGANGVTLMERTVRSSPQGGLSTRLETDLRGVRRLHGEVGRHGVPNAEYGEADVDLNPRCRVVGRHPRPAGPPSTPTAGQSTPPLALPAPAEGHFPGLALAEVVGAAVLLVGAAAVVGRRLRSRSR